MDRPVLKLDSNVNTTNSGNEFVSTYCQVLKFTDMRGHTKEMYFPKNLDLERPKRSRTNFTLKQLSELEKAFDKNQYLVGKERKSLSKQLDLSEAQIKIWYQNRRTKHKKEQFKQRERLAANAESIATTNIMKLLEQSQECAQHLQTSVQRTDKQNNRSSSMSSLSVSQCNTTMSAFKPIAESNPLFYSNSQWTDTNYLTTLYFSSPLHK